jgi:methionyl-tRNA formyltransferase
VPDTPRNGLRIGFAGTPEFAATILKGLITGGLAPELVLTQPDRPTGRGRKTKPSPVREVAESQDIPVKTPERLKGVQIDQHELDLLIVAAYGLILPARILSAPRLGCLNVHASLLPRWRGAAPVERAIMAGDKETGVCLMQMDEGLDTGPVYRCEALEIGTAETGGALEARLAEAGVLLLLAVLPELDSLTPTPQPPEGITYAAKLEARDSEALLYGSAATLARQIRALSDRQPVVLYGHDDAGAVRIRCLGPARHEDNDSGLDPGSVVRIDKAGLWLACGEGTVCIPSIQLNRGKGTVMGAKAAANGYSSVIYPGACLSTIPQAPTDPSGHREA